MRQETEIPGLRGTYCTPSVPRLRRKVALGKSPQVCPRAELRPPRAARVAQTGSVRPPQADHGMAREASTARAAAVSASKARRKAPLSRRRTRRRKGRPRLRNIEWTETPDLDALSQLDIPESREFGAESASVRPHPGWVRPTHPATAPLQPHPCNRTLVRFVPPDFVVLPMA